MSEQEFKKQAFKSTTIVEYVHPLNPEPVLCQVCEVDFVEQILTVLPIEKPFAFEKYQVNIKHCRIYDKKIKHLNS